MNFPIRHVLLAATFLLGLSQAADAARLIRSEITIDGKQVFADGYTAGDRTPVHQLWNLLATNGGYGEGATFKTDPADALTHALAGEIEITLMHTDKVLASAKLKQLQMVRSSSHSKDWRLSEPEMRRAAAVPGVDLNAEPPTNSTDLASSVVLIAVLLIAGVAILWLLEHRRPAN